GQIAAIKRYALSKAPIDAETVMMRFFNAYAVAIIGEHHQHVEQMITVISAPCYMQREINLGRCHTMNRMTNQSGGLSKTMHSEKAGLKHFQQKCVAVLRWIMRQNK